MCSWVQHLDKGSWSWRSQHCCGGTKQGWNRLWGPQGRLQWSVLHRAGAWWGMRQGKVYEWIRTENVLQIQCLYIIIIVNSLLCSIPCSYFLFWHKCIFIKKSVTAFAFVTIWSFWLEIHDLVGDYEVSIRFNDEHIPDSPFIVPVASPSDDARRLTVASLQVRLGDTHTRPCAQTPSRSTPPAMQQQLVVWLFWCVRFKSSHDASLSWRVYYWTSSLP